MGRWSGRVLGNLRQVRFPAAFRIQQPQDLQSTAAIVGEIRRAVSAALGRPTSASESPLGGDVPFLASLSTHLWRLRSRMLKPGSDEPREEYARLHRHLEALWDSLADAGVRIVDHTGAYYDPGLSLRVIAFEPRGDLSRETIIETLKPTVLLRETRIQIGEVIVGKPGRHSE